ncbi:MAG: hypothetical protein AABW73_04810 [Nanoarchaeota archaeon]
MNEKVLWGNNALKYTGAAGFFLIAAAIIWKISQGPSNFLKPALYLFSAIMLYLSINACFSKELIVTDKGARLGTYYLSKPKTLKWSFNALTSIFRRRIFISWKEIVSIKKESKVYRIYRIGGPSFYSKQEFYLIRTRKGNKFWVPVSSQSFKKRIIDLDKLLFSKGKKLELIENPTFTANILKLTFICLVLAVFLTIVLGF